MRGRSRQVGEIGAHVAEKGPGYNHLPGNARTDQAAPIGPRRSFERGCLPGAAAGHRHGTGRHHGPVARDARVAPDATVARPTTVAPDATNKYDDDDDLKRKSSSKGRKFATDGDPVENSENHSCAAEPRERQENAGRHLALVRAAYERATGNRWKKSDSEAYNENGLEKIPAGKIISTLEAVARRTPAKINSFKYFVKEIITPQDPRNRVWQKKQLEKIVRRIWDSSVGGSGLSRIDFTEDVKCACAREGVPFDHDIFNDLVS